MSDNVTELNIEKQSENVISGKKVVAIVVIAAIVVSVLGLLLFHDQFNLDGLRRWSKYFTVKNDETFGQYSFDSISSNCYASFSDGLAVASIGGLNVYDKNGEERYILQQPIDLPRLLAGGKTAVAYDVGGHSLVALRDGEGEVLRLEETHPILDADLSDNGAICLSSSASGYKSVLSVYNEDQDLVYRWLSSSAYYPLCAISESGREIAAVSLGQNDGEFESSVCIFRTDSEEIEQKISLGGELVYDLVYLKEDHLCAVGQNSVQFISAKDERVVTYQYKDAYLKDFDFGGFSPEEVTRFVSKADEVFQEQIKENGILLCKMDRADILEYEMTTGQSVLEAAKKLILQYSKDETLESGLEVLAEKSKLHDGADYVGYLLLMSMRSDKE